MSALRAYALVLAAGRGRRFGGDKLMAPLHGIPLLVHVVRRIQAAIDGDILAGALTVIPAGNSARAAALDALGAEWVTNPDSAEGLASSLRTGLGALARDHPEADAALVVPADHPLLPDGVIGRLLAAASQRPVVRPRYEAAPDVPGHPVLILRAFWPRVQELQGDAGFISLLESSPQLVTNVTVPGTNPGIDTPDDLDRLESLLS